MYFCQDWTLQESARTFEAIIKFQHNLFVGSFKLKYFFILPQTVVLLWNFIFKKKENKLNVMMSVSDDS